MKPEAMAQLDPVWADYKGIVQTPERTRLHDAVQNLLQHRHQATPLQLGEDIYGYIGHGFLTLGADMDQESYIESALFPVHDQFTENQKTYSSRFLEVRSRNPYYEQEPSEESSGWPQERLHSLFLCIAPEHKGDGTPQDPSDIFSHYVVSPYERKPSYEQELSALERPFVFKAYWNGDGPLPLNLNKQLGVHGNILYPERATTLEPYTHMAEEIEQAIAFLGGTATRA
jgi:hypothetical protein